MHGTTGLSSVTLGDRPFCQVVTGQAAQRHVQRLATVTRVRTCTCHVYRLAGALLGTQVERPRGGEGLLCRAGARPRSTPIRHTLCDFRDTPCACPTRARAARRRSETRRGRWTCASAAWQAKVRLWLGIPGYQRWHTRLGMRIVRYPAPRYPARSGMPGERPCCVSRTSPQLRAHYARAHMRTLYHLSLEVPSPCGQARRSWGVCCFAQSACSRTFTSSCVHTEVLSQNLSYTAPDV